MTALSTLCYIEQDGRYLMLHRTVKKNDVNKDKWIGVGGHFEKDESPEECLLREVKEETGYTLTSYRYRGIITFVSGNGVTEYMSLFTADRFEGQPCACDEGELKWIDKNEIWKLNLWEGTPAAQEILNPADLGIGTSMIGFTITLANSIAATVDGIAYDSLSASIPGIVGMSHGIDTTFLISAGVGVIGLLLTVLFFRPMLRKRAQKTGDTTK